MDHAVNGAPLNHEMSTAGRGEIMTTERSTLIGRHGEPIGREARNAVLQPDSFVTGPTGDLGVNDPDNHCGWED